MLQAAALTIGKLPWDLEREPREQSGYMYNSHGTSGTTGEGDPGKRHAFL